MALELASVHGCLPHPRALGKDGREVGTEGTAAVSRPQWGRRTGGDLQGTASRQPWNFSDAPWVRGETCVTAVLRTAAPQVFAHTRSGSHWITQVISLGGSREPAQGSEAGVGLADPHIRGRGP